MLSVPSQSVIGEINLVMIMVPVRRRNFSLRVPAPCGENRFARDSRQSCQGTRRSARTPVNTGQPSPDQATAVRYLRASLRTVLYLGRTGGNLLQTCSHRRAPVL